MTFNARASRLLFTALFSFPILSFSVTGVQGQYASTPQPGLPVGADFNDSEIDSVNLSTGNLYLHIPVLSYPQTGSQLRMNFFLRFNNPQWVATISTAEVQSANNQPLYKGQWVLSPDLYSNGAPHPIGVDVVRDQGMTLQTIYSYFMCVAADDTGPGDCATGDSATHYGSTGQAALGQYYSQAITYSVRDRSGAEHPVMASGGGNPNYGTLAISSPDGSGWTVASPSSQPTQFLDRNGNKYTVVPVTDSSGRSVGHAVNISDTNGNTITSDASGWNDTAGRHIPGSYSGPGNGFSIPSLANDPTYIINHPFENDPFPGVTAAQIPVQCNPGTTSSRIWDVPDIGNAVAHYILCYTVKTAAPVFPITDLNRYTASLENRGSTGELLTQFVLPNGTAYTFTYDSYFDLASVSLPTGAIINYTWTTIPWDASSLSQPLVRAITSRQETTATGDVRLWSYNWATVSDYFQNYGNVPGQITVTATVTKPDLNDEVHITTSTQRGATSTTTYWNGAAPSNPAATTKGTLLRTEVAEHQILQSPFEEPLPDLPPANDAGGRYHANWGFQDTYVGPVTTVTTTLDDGTVSQVVNTVIPASVITYERFGLNRYFEQDQNKVFTCACLQYGQVQASSVYDYGTTGHGTPGPLLRISETKFKWNDGSSSGAQYLNANLLDLVTSTTVSDASGALAKETDYSYDDANGSPQGYRGNLTNVNYQTLVMPPGQKTSAFTSRNIVFNSNGTHQSETDGNGNQTSWTYQCASSLPSTKTTPVNSGTTPAETTRFAYDCNTGRLTSTTDPNGIVRNYGYSDALGRLTEIDSAVGTKYESHESILYPSMLETDVTQDQNGLSDGLLKSSTVTDGLGHVVRTNDPAGYTTDTTYDPVWRVQSISNPHGSAASGLAGVISFAYDGLGRKLFQCNQDNGKNAGACSPGSSFKSWSYQGNTVTEHDEVAHQTATSYDALGRLSGVVSADSAHTAYTYSALDNLVQVNQGSSSGTATRIRTFLYDGLSRLLWANNPESGLVCYGMGDGTQAGCQANGYDGNNNLLYKTDARGVTTSYSYDALNRITSKTFSDGKTPTACFLYDGGGNASAINAIGRLSAAWTQHGLCASGSIVPTAGLYNRKLIDAYDAMGRVLVQRVCTKIGCTTEHSQPFSFDLASHLATYTDGLGSNTFTLSYDNGGRLSSLASSLVNATHPAVLFNVTEFGPFGWDKAALGGAMNSSKGFDVRERVTNLTVRAGAQ